MAFDLSIYYKFISHPFAHGGHRYPKGIGNPFYTSGSEDLLFVCRGCLCCVAWFSYRFDNLGLIIEGNTYRRCVASSLPLWGNTDVVQANINFLRPQLPSPSACHDNWVWLHHTPQGVVTVMQDSCSIDLGGQSE